MKNFILDSSINYIAKYNNYSNTKLQELKYGLETIYLTISKFIFILIICILLGITKEMIIYTLIYCVIRIPSFGLHATKSSICLVFSTLLFIGIPYLSLIIYLPINIKVSIFIICILLMYKNSPADTYKRPIVSKKRRMRFKFISVLVTTVFAFISILISNNFLSNCLLFSIVMQNFMISPYIYKLFGLPYNNYIEFLKRHPEYQE